MMNINFSQTQLIAAPFTPMKADGSVAYNQIPHYYNFLKAKGLHGAFICGTTGESASLTLEEKEQIFSTWAEVRDPDFIIIALVGGNCLPDAQRLALHAQACKLDAISLLAPFYFKPPSIEELIGYCASIAQVTPDMPVYYYHIPSMTGVDFPMLSFLTRADSAIPNLAGLKYTHHDLMDFHSCVHYKNKRYHMLWGRDEALLGALAMGAHGAVGSTYNYLAPVFHQLIQAFNEGDFDQATTYQAKANSCISVLIKYGGSSTGKLFMRLAGMDCGPYRLPIAPLASQTEASIEAELHAVGFYSLNQGI